ncbi:MAG: cation-translocating P-type ATPase [Heliobacteriaceae bacterium]|jgi:heavy metal translocating P-type ATPase|nr:cation-translocating P-type ATPase [Heliobacteriaceae bacterium]
MLKTYIDKLSGLKMTIISGLFLLGSFVLMITKTRTSFDPAWISVLISGLPLVYYAVVRLIFQRSISSPLLISIAMAAAIITGELFAAGEVAFIMAAGGLLEEYTTERAQKGISKLMSLAPQQGRRINGAIEEIIPAGQIQKGDIIRVFPGETIPVDGEIISGETSADQSVMTGESLPVDKMIGDSVFSGTMNLYGSVDVRALHVGKDSSLQKMIDLVKEAENKKAPTQRIVDKWASWLVPAALLIAVITYLATGEVVRAVTVLVVFCPCALTLATPTSIAAAIGQAAKHGVLIKSGEALEKMGKTDFIAFDKTGTLTQGKLEVSDIISFDAEIPPEELLALVCAAEIRSEHPLAKAVAAYAKINCIEIPKADNFKMAAGMGVQSNVSGSVILCGNRLYFKENGILLNDNTEKELKRLQKHGKASILAAKDGSCIGVIALSDLLRENIKSIVAGLEQINAEVALLTGDNRQAAEYFAQNAGIKNIYSELLPADKAAIIRRLQSEGKKVCMTGDGVNDAPSLKTADVGIAMGNIGSDMAIEAADIALMNDNIANILYIKKLSNAAITSIKQNITLSMLINFAAIGLSVYGLLNPVTGALVHNLGSVIVVLNAARLYDRKVMVGF